VPDSIAVVYGEMQSSHYEKTGENKAVLSVLDCVDAVQEALLKLRYRVTAVPLSPPPESLRSTLGSLDAGLIFNLFEGFPGEPETEALVPEILSELEMPCTGCPARALRTALDKFALKKLLRATGIPTPDFQLLSPQKINLFRLKFPCIVKPYREDASHGITPESVVNDIPSLRERVKTIYDNYGNQAIVEEFLSGREFNATVIGGKSPEVLPVSEIVYTLPAEMPAILTFEAKWEPDSIYYRNSRAICPAKITAEERASICKISLAAFNILGGSGYARVDMRSDSRNIINVIEVNPNPDISPGAGVALQAAAAGMNYTRLIERIVRLALDGKRNGTKNKTCITAG
jgi:D-alanine-D-alanine ligase